MSKGRSDDFIVIHGNGSRIGCGAAEVSRHGIRPTCECPAVAGISGKRNRSSCGIAGLAGACHHGSARAGGAAAGDVNGQSKTFDYSDSVCFSRGAVLGGNDDSDGVGADI